VGTVNPSSRIAQPTARVATPATSGRRRRPSGEAPPLPRHVAASTRWYALSVLALVPLELAMAFTASRGWLTRLDDAVLRALARLRSPALVDVLHAVNLLAASVTVRVVAWTTIAVLVLARRFHHLVAYLVVFLTAGLLATGLALVQGRMRPVGVHIAGDWSGYSHPSVPVATVAVATVGVLYTTLPRGRWRNRGKWLAGGAVAALCVARLLLAVDHPTDVLAALAIGWSLPVIVYRLLTPDEAFPITYRRTTRAHLDVGGERGRAIVRALADQLGVHADTVEPFGLGGSAGSTPLRITAHDDAGRAASLFAKLYAVNHLRSDRSYKLSRMILYGRLEDEKPFSTVRRLVEYEDHMLRLLRDAGLPVPRPAGLVEITPEREYMVVMGFIDGAHELGTEPVGDREIDDALRIVARLWAVGVAHRDIKPSNVLTRNGKVYLIDVAFATVRPTPWRQAVDLANMMLTLALVSTAEAVYARAVRIFAAEDVAEAFAASRSITVPTQLRTRLRADGRDLAGTFRALAPHRAPVAIQLWTLRRMGVTSAAALGLAVGAFALYLYLRLTGLL
jgi:tRNA A-37 threonylcarbamoyl transferase component Bud32/membrane-associated phospholipid phosphatase